MARPLAIIMFFYVEVSHPNVNTKLVYVRLKKQELISYMNDFQLQKWHYL